MIITDPYKYTDCVDCVHHGGRNPDYFGSCENCIHEATDYFYHKLFDHKKRDGK